MDHRDYGALFRGTVGRMVLVSVAPILAVGAVGFLQFSRYNRAIALDQHAAIVRQHRESVGAFLDGLTAQLTTLAHQYSLSELAGGELERAFRVIRRKEGVFTDIGVIDSRGAHVRYVGPYDLSSRNYRETEWFRLVVEKGVHVSDMFLGYRGVPHFVIAVRRDEGPDFWILRATVDTDYFSRMVDATRAGRTGETFIVNPEGLLQTATLHGGRVLTPSGLPDIGPHEGVRVREVDFDGRTFTCTSTWLARPRWLLVFRQENTDLYAPLRRATAWGLAAVLAGAAGGVGLAVVVARRQVGMIRKADGEKEALVGRLLVAGRTAAVGELSAGVAHGINNPLATIDVLRTWIADIAGGGQPAGSDRAEILESAARIGEQVARCKAITGGLLSFSRRVEAKAEAVDVVPLLRELAAMASARAGVEGVALVLELQPAPPVFASSSHLQQVFMNLVNNAIDAAAGRPGGRVSLRSGSEAGRVRIDVVDNGCGITGENMARIFVPFFTTKAVGKGTGLGLAIAHGLVRSLGGEIRVESEAGEGATFTVLLPPAAGSAGSRA